MNDKRKIVEKYIIDSISKIDKKNAEYYKKFFDSLSDSKFDKFMKALKTGDTNIHVYFPNFKKSITNNEIFKLADEFKVSLYEQIRLKNDISNTTYFSPVKFLILNLPVRRVTQYLFSKIRLPESDKHISKLSGQAMKPDKGGKISLIETYILASKGFERSLLELIKVRGGDLDSYYNLKNQLLQNGMASVSSLSTSKTKPKSVIVMDSYLKALHIDIGLQKGVE